MSGRGTDCAGQSAHAGGAPRSTPLRGCFLRFVGRRAHEPAALEPGYREDRVPALASCSATHRTALKCSPEGSPDGELGQWIWWPCASERYFKLRAARASPSTKIELNCARSGPRRDIRARRGLDLMPPGPEAPDGLGRIRNRWQRDPGAYHVEAVVAEGALGSSTALTTGGSARRCAQAAQGSAQSSQQQAHSSSYFGPRRELFFGFRRAFRPSFSLHVDAFRRSTARSYRTSVLEWLEGVRSRADHSAIAIGLRAIPLRKLVRLLTPSARALERAHNFGGPRVRIDRASRSEAGEPLRAQVRRRGG